MTQHIVEEILAPELSDADRATLDALYGIVFPPRATPFPVSAPAPSIDWPNGQARRIFVVRHEGRIVATASFLPRRIQTSQGALDVLALAGVGTLPGFRLHGLGRLLVRAAFDYVDKGAFGVSLFQTGVPGFYEKLGCRRVANPFVNSLGANPHEMPWWDAHNMIYPAAYPWPEGPVDLVGPGW